MKTLNYFVALIIILLVLSFSKNSYCTTWTVQVADFQFTPNTLNISVGDSVKWVWVNGNHTTTSLGIPTGAIPWDRAISVEFQTFVYVPLIEGLYQYKCTPHFPSMVGSFNVAPIGIIPISNNIPEIFNLYQNYPNPFNPSTKISFDIPAAASGNTILTVFDMLGREIAVLVNEQLKPGTYEVEWNGSDFSSGVYYYNLQAGDYVNTRKMTLVK